MTPVLRLIASSLVLGSLAGADTPPALAVITAIDAHAMTLTVQTSPSATDTTTFTLTSATVIQTLDHVPGKLGDLVVGDHVALTLSGTTATEVDILPLPPLTATGNGSNPPGGGHSGAGGDGGNPGLGGEQPAGSPRSHH